MASYSLCLPHVRDKASEALSVARFLHPPTFIYLFTHLQRQDIYSFIYPPTKTTHLFIHLFIHPPTKTRHSFIYSPTYKDNTFIYLFTHLQRQHIYLLIHLPTKTRHLFGLHFIFDRPPTGNLTYPTFVAFFS